VSQAQTTTAGSGAQASSLAPEPGDFAVVTTPGWQGWFIGMAQMIFGGYLWSRRRRQVARKYRHAWIYMGWVDRERLSTLPGGYSHARAHGWSGDGYYEIEARPSGAGWHFLGVTTGEVMNCFDGSALWSTGKLPLSGAERDVVTSWAIKLVGTPYSFLDYLAIQLRHLHIPAPGLRAYIKATGHEICSQLVDYCRSKARALFSDGRWYGLVMPADLAWLLLTTGQS
jgi:hypothetical protein